MRVVNSSGLNHKVAYSLSASFFLNERNFIDLRYSPLSSFFSIFKFWLGRFCYTIIPQHGSQNDDYITTIESGWNTVGVPDNQIINKTDILVDDESWSTAVSNGWVSDFIFGWNEIGQSYVFYDTFIPGKAYWMYAYQDCVLKQNN